MIQISEEIYINKSQILYIKKEDDCLEIFMTQGNFSVYEYSSYYWSVMDLLEKESDKS